MKTIQLLMLIFLTGSVTLLAQPYQITFTGSGLSNTVATVEVQNLTQGTTLTLAGTDILELVTNIGISDPLTTKGEILIYPNPAESNCRMEFYNKQPGDVHIELFDATGKLLLRKDQYLPEGNHSYRIGGLKSGMYALKVSTPAGSYSKRIISTGIAEGVPFLEYAGMATTKHQQAKQASPASIIQMQYNAGERLLFKGISGIYSRVITLLPTQSWAVNFEFIACTDGDGNHYPVVTIGTQTWMAENLKTTKYRSSTTVPIIMDSATWAGIVTGARCWYNNDSATYAATYGALYNWYAVISAYGLCPTGWHVPTDAEWTVLTDFLGGLTLAGGPLKETGTAHWGSPNTGATNSSGFTALPGGNRNYGNGNFNSIGGYGYWWSSTAHLTNYALSRILHYTKSTVYWYEAMRRQGYSVRCVRD